MKLRKLRELNTIQKILLSVYVISSLVLPYNQSYHDLGYYDPPTAIILSPFYLIFLAIPAFFIIWLFGNNKK